MSVLELVERCRQLGIPVGEIDARTLAPATILPVSFERWRVVAVVTKKAGFRFSAFWVSEAAADFSVFNCVERDGKFIVVRTLVPATAALPSIAGVYPSADRPERHAADLLGVRFFGAPDARRWSRHLAWGPDEFPLRAGAEVQGAVPTPPDDQYPFVAASGAGVVEIPVGPVHAGVIEPGHFRFLALGETVLNLEAHLGYVHKGIEKLGVGRDATQLARLAGRISGDSTVAHSWAACQAVERALGIEVPARALWLRALMSERERIANHLGDIGAICNDVGFSFAQAQMTRLKELWVRGSLQTFGHRLMMDRVIPGGVDTDPANADLQHMLLDAVLLAREFAALIETIEGSESLEDRLMTTGRLEPQLAKELGCVGYVGKASGLTFDVRHDAAYAPYDELAVPVAHYRAGDVAARARVRADEVIHSAHLIEELIRTMPAGNISVPVATTGEPAEGLGIVESWRGEIVTYVALDASARVLRFFPRDPSWLLWPALELLAQDNIVPDFPVCNKSVNGSYSGHDL